MAHMFMEALAATGEMFYGADVAKDTERDDAERTAGGVGSIGGIGTLVGGAAQWMGAGAGIGALSEAGAIVSAESGILGAGALGYEVGSAIDKRADISGNLAGNREDQWEDTLNQSNLSPQNVRGTAGIAFANRQRASAVDAQSREQAEDATAKAQIADMWSR